MFFDPEYWREYFKPHVKAIADYAHSKGLMVIYHSCGRIHPIISDYIEVGINAMNPLEAKAGLDAVDLRKEHGKPLGMCGNSNMMVWETGDKKLIREEVLRKLNAAKGGSYIFQSDHSVSTCNIQNYSIYLRCFPDGKFYLFSYFEYVGSDFETDMTRMASDETIQKWWAVCKPYHKRFPGCSEAEHWAEMEEVFHLD